MAYSNPRLKRRLSSKVQRRFFREVLNDPEWPAGGFWVDKDTPRERYQERHYQGRKKSPVGLALLVDGRGVLCKCGKVALRVVRRVRGRITICSASLCGDSMGELARTYHSRLVCRPWTEEEVRQDIQWWNELKQGNHVLKSFSAGVAELEREVARG